MDMAQLQLARTTGELDRSLSRLEKQRADAQRLGDPRQAAVLGNDLGVAYYVTGEFERARTCLLNTLEAFVSLKDTAGEGHAAGNLARVEERLGHIADAAARYQQAADLLHTARAFDDEFATLKMLSQLYLRNGAWLPALAAFDRALVVKPRKGPLDGLLHWLYQIPLRMMGYND